MTERKRETALHAFELEKEKMRVDIELKKMDVDMRTSSVHGDTEENDPDGEDNAAGIAGIREHVIKCRGPKKMTAYDERDDMD